MAPLPVLLNDLEATLAVWNF